MSPTRLYVITPPQIASAEAFADDLRAVLAVADGCVAAVQLRLKGVDEAGILRMAEHLLPVCHAFESILLINDNPALCGQAGADGVHLGQGDTSCGAARTLLGPDKTIGVTCHNSRHLGLLAGEAGADYVAFGAFFPTRTKEVAHIVSPDLLAWWAHATTLPSVAIGGITAGNASPLIAAGADFLAVSGALWQAEDGAEAATGRFTALLAASRYPEEPIAPATKR